VNATLPKGTEPTTLTVEKALELIAAKAGSAKGGKKASAKKAPAKKASAAKAKSTKKTTPAKQKE